MSKPIEHHLDESGELHRIDGPAIAYSDGSKFWCRHGKRHRREGPAVVWGDGSKLWYHHGKLHRRGGPAEMWGGGTMFWYVNGRNFPVSEKFPEALHPIMELFL